MRKKAEGKADRAWEQFCEGLAAALADLGEEAYLIISVKKTDHFVQFAGHGTDCLRAEAKSNYFIEEEKHKLSGAAQKRLVRLGWNEPTYEHEEDSPEPVEGSCNYYKDVASPVPFDEIAALAVTTLRDVYAVKNPVDLVYDAFTTEGDPIEFPSLTIPREPTEGEPSEENPLLTKEEFRAVSELVDRLLDSMRDDKNAEPHTGLLFLPTLFDSERVITLVHSTRDKDGSYTLRPLFIAVTDDIYQRLANPAELFDAVREKEESEPPDRKTTRKERHPAVTDTKGIKGKKRASAIPKRTRGKGR